MNLQETTQNTIATCYNSETPLYREGEFYIGKNHVSSENVL